jgi:SIR2-like domain
MLDRERIDSVVIPYLRDQFARALPFFFTGAGFSRDAMNILGLPIPAGADLKRELWNVCFPGKAYEEDNSLQDLYEQALVRHKGELATRIAQSLTVDADSIPAWYRVFFSFPWAGGYTVNVDDLATATARAHELPRKIAEVSARSPLSTPGTPRTSSDTLEIVHLNGTIADVPDRVTFSVTQFAERLGVPDPWYFRLTGELISRPFVFIGTQLDEPSLWQYLEVRRSKGARGMKELRPGSYLVTSHLPLARQALLAEYNIEWLQMTAEQFTSNVLGPLGAAATAGLDLLRRSTGPTPSHPVLPDVSTLSRAPMQPSDFLLGQEPVWGDLQSGRAIVRESDEGFRKKAGELLAKEGTKGVLLVTGTAGSGKSTALMRLSLSFSAGGVRVGWIDRETDLTVRDVRRGMKAADAPAVLAIDEADMFGAELPSLVREVALSEGAPLLMITIRSGKVERALSRSQIVDVPIDEVTVPLLADSDIGALLDALAAEQRLGRLKGVSRGEQVRAFREQADRELLVAMIQATSGERFEAKAVAEFEDLQPNEQTFYALVAVATALRYTLTSQDILIASGDASNTALNIVDQLKRRHIIVAPAGDKLAFRARHRVIAQLVFDHLQKNQRLADVMAGLALAAATKVNPTSPTSSRAMRFLRSVISHDLLIRTVGREVARNIYGSIEVALSWSFHYWLQRGSLEVEAGDLSLAKNFLDQSRSLAPDDPFVENEYAYLQFSRALSNVAAVDAPQLVKDAVDSLLDLIRRRRHGSEYPYHVLGSQGLSWARRGVRRGEEKERFLLMLIATVEEGVQRFPYVAELKKLLQDLKKEQLGSTAS